MLTASGTSTRSSCGPQYSDIARQALNELLVAQMASGEKSGIDELTAIAVDITMGSINAENVDRLRAGLEAIPALGLTTTQYQA